MSTTITHITILVADQNKALDFYTKKLGFKLHTDALLDEGFRWLTVCPTDNENVEIALVPAKTQEEKAIIGKQAGSYPLCSFSSTDCKKMYEEISKRGVEFIQEPIERPWGIEAMFKDLYGNILHINQTL